MYQGIENMWMMKHKFAINMLSYVEFTKCIAPVAMGNVCCAIAPTFRHMFTYLVYFDVLGNSFR